MTEQKLDELLKQVYSRTDTVPEDWNENLLQNQGRRKIIPWYRRGVAVATMLLCLIGISGSVYACFRLMTPAQTAREMEMTAVAEQFEKQQDEVQSITTKGFRIHYLGAVTGKNLEDGLEGVEVEQEKTYIVTAIERENGTAMTLSDRFFVGPFIEGLDPLCYNIAANGSSAVRTIDHGVLYCITSCDTIGIFAKRNLYLAVQEGTFYDANAYSMDKKDGVMRANQSYEKVNALFSVKLDESMADEEKAKAFIAEIEKEKAEPADEPSQKKDAVIGENVKFPSDYVRKYDDITVTLRTYGYAKRQNCIDSSAYSNGNLILNFLPKVEGKQIKNVSFQIHGGTFHELDRLSSKQAIRIMDDLDYMFNTKYHWIYHCDEYDDDSYWGMQKQGTDTIHATVKNGVAEAHYALKTSKKCEADSYSKYQKKILKSLEDNTRITMKVEKEDGTVLEKEIRFKTTIYGTRTDGLFNVHYAYYKYDMAP